MNTRKDRKKKGKDNQYPRTPHTPKKLRYRFTDYLEISKTSRSPHTSNRSIKIKKAHYDTV